MTDIAPSAAVADLTPGESTDVSQRNVDKLQRGALGLPGIMLLSMASAAPLVGALGNIPLGIGLGNGAGMAGGYILVTVVLLLFSVGYAAMANKLTAAGGFYSFISHGIGRPFGMAAGWSAQFGYLLVEVALIGALGYFTNNTMSTLLHIHLAWWSMVYRDRDHHRAELVGREDLDEGARRRAGDRDTGVAGHVDFAVLVKGGPGGTPLSPINPVNAFKGIAPGVGIFFAFWSFLGFEVLPNYAEESRDPRRHTRVGLYASVTIIGVVYVLVAWAGVVGHGVDGVSKAATSDPVNFYYDLSTSYVGTWLTDVMKMFVCVSSLACALAFHQTTSRYFYALGRENILPSALGRTHPKWGSPTVAVVVQGILVSGAVLLFIGFWYVSKPAQAFSGTFANAPYFELFGWLAIATTFFVLFNQVLSSIATVLFFRRDDHQADGNWWSTLVAPTLGGIGMAVAIYLLVSNLQTVGGDVIFVKLIPWVCIGWFIVGLGLALWFRVRRPRLYQDLGRVVNRSLVIAEGEPVDVEPVVAVTPARSRRSDRRAPYDLGQPMSDTSTETLEQRYGPKVHELAPAVAEIMQASLTSTRPNAHLLPVVQARRNFDSDFGEIGPGDPVLDVADHQVRVDGGEITVRAFRPLEGVLPAIVYFHGGGWLLGSLDSHEAVCRALANASGAVVVSVGYRRGPEARFPTAVNDAVRGDRPGSSTTGPLGIDPARVAAAGDSAGANLAIATALLARSAADRSLAMLLLAYPVTTTDLDVGFDSDYEGFQLYRDEMQWHQDNYLPSPEARHRPAGLPAGARRPPGLPPTLVITAQCDPLHRQGELFAQALQRAGVSAEHRQWPGMIHGFVQLPSIFTEGAEAIEVAAAALRRSFGAARSDAWARRSRWRAGRPSSRARAAGIGRGVARRFAEAGANLVLTARTATALQALSDELGPIKSSPLRAMSQTPRRRGSRDCSAPRTVSGASTSSATARGIYPEIPIEAMSPEDWH